MVYDNFTKQTLFTDNNANVLCNRLYNALETEFTKVVLDTKFCITGTLAKILNGALASDIKVIPFITNDDAIYDYCAKNLPKYLKATAVIFKDRIQLQYQSYYLEVWKTSSIGTIGSVSGFLVQDDADIPSNIL